MKRLKSLLSFTVLVYLLFACSQKSFCQIRLPKLISSGMVLQRNTNVRIWGWAKPGEGITVRFHGHTYQTTTANNKQWSVMLSPMTAGGPYSMQIDGSNHIYLDNIYIGEVWICSGQSNMVLPMKRVAVKYPDVIAHSQNPEIRQFFVPMKYNFNHPDSDLSSGDWEPANPWNVMNFTAAGYFFARALFAKYHVPIGLINASIGGTPVTAWMSKEALKEFPSYITEGEKFGNSHYADSVSMQDDINTTEWNKHEWDNDEGLTGDIPWYKPQYNASSWLTISLPDYWQNEGVNMKNGVIWFRKEFNVPPSVTGKEATLFLGRVVNEDYAYINGMLVGNISYQYPPGIFKIAPGILKPGKNLMVVRVISRTGYGGFIKDKPYEIKEGNQKIDLKGKWKYKIGAVARHNMPATTFIQYEPMGLFNGMIAPLLNYTIKGTIWYQGESNTGDTLDYHQLFSSMITDWRQQWGEGNFPFLFVQLPNYGDMQKQPALESGWAAIRSAQLRTLSLPNTGMAVSIDVGEWNDLHPLDKEDVGKRLALAAEHIAYGDDKIVYSSPICQSMKVEGNKVILTFDHTGTGLMTKNKGALKCFSIEGQDGKLLWATAKIMAPDKVMVWNDLIAHPVMVQYAWSDSPDDPNLYNKEGLPASPFRMKIKE